MTPTPTDPKKAEPPAGCIERGHCWHDTGEVLTSYPPQYPQVCCWCPAKRTNRPQFKAPAGHGPRAPFVLVREP
jgi:hypothetical protein